MQNFFLFVIAHERWFPANTSSMSKPLMFTHWNQVNSAFVLSAIFGLLAVVLLHFGFRSKRFMKHLQSFWGNFRSWTSPLLRVLTGLLLFVASLSRFLFAPDLQANILPSSVEISLLAIQLIVGLGLVIGLFPRFMASLGAALFLSLFLFFQPLAVLSYIFFLGIFAYLIINGDPTLPRVRNLKLFHAVHAFINFPGAAPFSMAILRFAAGFSFILVAFVNKIYDPLYALALVHGHRLNFMPSLGFANFSNEMFVLAAGLTEIVLGILIVLGIFPRLIGGLIIVLFTLTLSVFGINELLGHLPLYAVAFALLFQGAGQRWSLELSTKPK